MRCSVAAPWTCRGARGRSPGRGGCWTVRSPLLGTGLHVAVTGRSLPATLMYTPAAGCFFSLQVMKHLPSQAAHLASN